MTFCTRIFYLVSTLVLAVTNTATVRPITPEQAPTKNAPANWTFVIFMRPSSNLQEFVIKNIESIARGGVMPGINVVIQENNALVAQRFQVINHAIIDQETLSVEPDDEINLVNTMAWAVEKFPAEQYALIVWGNGAGVLDQHFIPSSGTWEFEETVLATAAQPCQVCQVGTCSQQVKRAVAFDDALKRFLSTAGLGRALTTISEKVLRGQKLAIIGMDACRMAMAEVAYEVRGTAQYLIGCENCTPLPDGWNYEQIFARMDSTGSTPEDICRLIVTTFQEFYEKYDHTKTYTESAIALAHIEQLAQELSTIAKLCCTNQTDTTLLQTAKTARNGAISMCNAPCYIDLGTWLIAFENAVAKDLEQIAPDTYTQLQRALAGAHRALGQAVLASVNGPHMAGVQGISIYFPQSHLDSSYDSAQFGRATGWTSLIRTYLKL